MTAASRQSSVDDFGKTVAAGCIPPWQIDELIPPPARHHRSLAATGVFFLAITLVAGLTL